MGEIRKVDVMQPLLRANDWLAAQLNAEWTRQGIVTVNLISAPGAGKTALIEATLQRWRNRYRFLVLEGDIETERDAERIRRLGVDAVQITTGGACHLEAHMIRQAWESLDIPQPPDFLFIENVGNLVCPASFALGEHARVVVLSVPEGDDKPAKYPKAFRTAHACVITKIDLIPHFAFDLERCRQEIRRLNPDLTLMTLSPTRGDGMETWLAWLESLRPTGTASANPS